MSIQSKKPMLASPFKPAPFPQMAKEMAARAGITLEENAPARSTKQVIKAIGNEHLSLVAGKGYWYFVYDDVAKGRYDTYSVCTMRLGDFTVEQWATEGREFVEKMESK